jgi:predicted nuclease with TOPRIM domain
MEEQDWKNIIDELTEQIKQISIERAVARGDVRKAKQIIDGLKQRIEELENETSAEVHRITTKE